jgi:hypothetical protein
MGITVNAHLGYGVHITEEQYDDLPWAVIETDEEDEMGFDDDPEMSIEPKPSFADWVAELAGLVDPSAHIVDRNEGWSEWYAVSSNAEAMSIYWRLKREAEEKCPIGYIRVSTGADWEPCVIVAVKSSVSLARWAEPIEAVTAVSEDDMAAAAAFCAEHKIPFEDPKWLLVAETDYGS